MSKVRVISLKEVIKKTSMSKSSVYRGMKAGKFPLAIRLDDGDINTDARRVAWFESEIEEWLQRRPRVVNLHWEEM
ncbi:AlpA family phage regulatory protein [Vibrio parahaemolyticus]|nr:AlpA family phage regulatory protein [Vibrio parahaemolyticus]MBE3828540.1 AlpA family phage regulatory protein [Vibrio parahaemolyticus]MBE3983866.1 AlpA family phage regulatory protein [Vibrio parahaemolyticus]HCG7194491.1 AlpA family phage regulatory protein [Vibrio parahaemolyticus]